MKRQSDDRVTSRVYAYGCVPGRIAPVRNEEAALYQMRLGRRLWNVLVAIDRARLERYKRVMNDETQERIGKLTEEIGVLRAEIQSARKSGRKRSVGLGALPERIAGLRSNRATLIEERKATATTRHVARKEQLDDCTAVTHRRIKKARQAAAALGLFWGSYNDIVQRADAGRKLGKLQFRGFRGDGTLTAQVMGGAPVPSCVGAAHTFFQIDALATDRRWGYARMRIGSNADRSPVWLEIPIVYHRPIPAVALIKSVSATRRVVAGKTRWQLNVTVSIPKPQPRRGNRVVAVDLGWRLLPEGVRVAYWHDGDRHGQVLVPASDIDLFAKVGSLRSICDRTRDEFLPALAAWLNNESLPEEWVKRSAYLIQWRSSDRIAALIRWWADNRLVGDQEIFAAALAWRKQYLHLANWWRNMSEKLTARIREQYRIFAAQLAQRYDALIIEEFDLRDVARVPAPESEEVRYKNYRCHVSPSTFRAALTNAASREGLAVIKLDAAYTTRTCHACRATDKWDQAESVKHRCESCGAVWDQDLNAALNMLIRWRASEELVEGAEA